MRAFSLSTRVEGSSETAVTFPTTSPSMRRPPVKFTLPSILVPTPIRLSMRFCGLLGCLRNINVSRLLRKVDVLAGTRLAGSVLQDARLYGTHLGSRWNPERSLNPAKILEVELESDVPRIGRIGNDDCNILALLLHLHNKLERPVKFTVELAPLQDQQAVTELAREHVAFDLEPVNADFLAAPLGRDEVFEKSEILLETVVLVFERLHLGGKLDLRRLLDLQARLARVGDGAQSRGLALEPGHGFAKPPELVLELAAIKTGKTAPGIVHPGRQGERERQEHEHPEPAPVPGDVRLHGHLRGRNSEALAELLEQLEH